VRDDFTIINRLKERLKNVVVSEIMLLQFMQYCRLTVFQFQELYASLCSRFLNPDLCKAPEQFLRMMSQSTSDFIRFVFSSVIFQHPVALCRSDLGSILRRLSAVQWTTLCLACKILLSSLQQAYHNLFWSSNYFVYHNSQFT
jgi:hypothetical protein